MKIVNILVLSLMFAVSIPMSHASGDICYVADPSSTPLNVRKSVWGKITDKLPDGKEVQIINYTHDKKGKPWAKIAYWRGNDYREGWVYYNYLNCY